MYEKLLEEKRKKLETTMEHWKKLIEDGYTEDNKEWIMIFKNVSGYADKDKRVVRSISLSYKVDDYITQVQKQAKENGNFISKDVIINIAVYNMLKVTEEEGIDNFNRWIRTFTD